ncbi:MAG TPA: hydrogenase maturation nickel metallochaperone HypA [Anaerolineales bacterium]|nr:hydrogenase maturation nickel metallochaperone HypA [Anaerolineales bacterium]
MHELSAAESILEISLRYAQQADAVRVTDLYLVIGQLASIMDDSVQYYWDIIAKDTAAEGARLHFKRVPAEFLCLDCGNIYTPGEETLTCPSCESMRIKVTAGQEFLLDSIDVETIEKPVFSSLEK